MTRSFRPLLALSVGIALAIGTELFYGYLAAVHMPWLHFFGKHTTTCILLLLDLCIGVVPAYLAGRLIFRHVGNFLRTALLVGLPWIIVCIYFDYEGIRELQLHPAFPSALQATLHSWLFWPGMLISMLSVPVGLWLAFQPRHRSPTMAP